MLLSLAIRINGWMHEKINVILICSSCKGYVCQLLDNPEMDQTLGGLERTLLEIFCHLQISY